MLSSSEYYMNFDTDGEWDKEFQIGPAAHAPDDARKIIVDNYRIEWLNLSEPENDFYSNHMVATLVFAENVIMNDIAYSSARLSMELGPSGIVAEIHSQKGFKSGNHYLPGLYTLMLLCYKSPTRRTVHHSTYALRQGTTGSWKGCGDHVWAAEHYESMLVHLHKRNSRKSTMYDTISAFLLCLIY